MRGLTSLISLELKVCASVLFLFSVPSWGQQDLVPITETTLEAFSKIMGPVIMKKVENAYVYNSKLVLKLTSAPLRQEISMEKTKLISMINQELGSDFLKDILLN